MIGSACWWAQQRRCFIYPFLVTLAKFSRSPFYNLKQRVDFDQMRMDTFMEGGKEMIRIWWPSLYFPGHNCTLKYHILTKIVWPKVISVSGQTLYILYHCDNKKAIRFWWHTTRARIGNFFKQHLSRWSKFKIIFRIMPSWLRWAIQGFMVLLFTLSWIISMKARINEDHWTYSLYL